MPGKRLYPLGTTILVVLNKNKITSLLNGGEVDSQINAI